jgi:hypothetical protein
VSWVIPTAFSLIALKQSFPCCRTERIANRIQLGTEMLRDRACPQGAWNAGNGVVFGTALSPHIDATAVALLALAGDGRQSFVTQALDWLRNAYVGCASVYSLAWSAIAFLTHQDEALDHCIVCLQRALSSRDAISVETLSVAAIAMNATEGHANPFQAVI